MKEMDERLFDLFVKYKDDYFRLYLEIKELFSKEIVKARSEENVHFYDVLRRLSNSINNAGCEERRSQQIELIDEEMEKIITNYEEHLP